MIQMVYIVCSISVQLFSAGLFEQAMEGGRERERHRRISKGPLYFEFDGYVQPTMQDIFAGIDFTLRGNGRNIVHREYLHVAKGRWVSHALFSLVDQ